MTLDVQQCTDQLVVNIAGLEVKKVFRQTCLRGSNVAIPTLFYILSDPRPASQAALQSALQGIAPTLDPECRFDPLWGPFSSVKAKMMPWAQRLEFMRDIKSASLGSKQLAPAWIESWLNDQHMQDTASYSFLAAVQQNGTKADRLVSRSRRILNCLSHVLPFLDQLDSKTRSLFWGVLLHDITKVGAPTDTLWSSLKDGFDPLSRRALWMRAVALLGVEAALPSLLRTDLVNKSFSDVKASIQSNGLMQGGSIMGTLSAGADLCMLSRLPAIEPILDSIRLALVSLRHGDGTLVTFGTGATEYSLLLNAVIGSDNRKAPALLLDGGIVRAAAANTTVWLRGPQTGRAFGSICEIGSNGSALITSCDHSYSAVELNGKVEAYQVRCKRRDEPESLIIEASAMLTLLGKNYKSLRQIRLSKNGALIEGEDIFRPESANKELIVREIRFVIPISCATFLSNDKESVLIVTSQQQAWRFRAQGMDISVEMGSDTTLRKVSLSKRYFIVCRCPDMQRKSDFRATWQLVLEDLE
jgi:hypothetical protein